MKSKETKTSVKDREFLEVCTQPQCMVRDEGFDPELAAGMLVQILSGEDVSEAIPEDRRIVGFERCNRCALSVLEGGRPIATPEELKELVAAGRRSHRRFRRSRTHG